MGRASREKDNKLIFKCLMGEKVKINYYYDSAMKSKGIQ